MRSGAIESSPSKRYGAGGIVMRRSWRRDRDRERGVTALVGLDERGEQGPLLGARRPGRPLRAPGRQVGLHRRARTLERAVRRRNAGLEERGGLHGRPAEHVPGDQRRPLPGREELHRREECQLDGLALDHDGVGLVVGRRGLVEHPSGYGWSHGTSAKERSVVRRRDRRRIMSRHTFVAIR